MMLKDLLKKKEKIKNDAAAANARTSSDANAPSTTTTTTPEFTFVRTTTTTQEVIAPPAFPGEQQRPVTSGSAFLSPDAAPASAKKNENRKSIFGRSLSSAGNSSSRPGSSDKRLSERLHFGGGRSRSASSLVNLPSDLPDVDEGVARSAEHEAQWEKRATILAKGTLISKSGNLGDSGLDVPRRSPSPAVSDPGKDVGFFFLFSICGGVILLLLRGGRQPRTGRACAEARLLAIVGKYPGSNQTSRGWR